LPAGAAGDLHVSGVTLDDGVGRLAVLVANLVPAAADEALDGEEGVLGVNHALTLGDLSGFWWGSREGKVRKGSYFYFSSGVEKKLPSTAVGARLCG
jgi:hypothetical protein